MLLSSLYLEYALFVGKAALERLSCLSWSKSEQAMAWAREPRLMSVIQHFWSPARAPDCCPSSAWELSPVSRH